MKFSTALVRLTGIFVLCTLILYVLPQATGFSLPFSQSLLITAGSFVISTLILFLLLRGADKESKTRVVLTFAGITLKFILYLVLLLIAYFFLKKLTPQFIVTFFVIYLTFTFFVIFSLLKAFKSNS
jgi:F0F1-type ATP synthase assembly protein I